MKNKKSWKNYLEKIKQVLFQKPQKKTFSSNGASLMDGNCQWGGGGGVGCATLINDDHSIYMFEI